MAVRTDSLSRFRYWPAWLTLVVGLGASAGLGWKLQRDATFLDQQRLALRIKEITSQLEGRLEKTESLLKNLQDYLNQSGEARNSVLREWCRKQGLSWNHPWVLGIVVFTNQNAASWRQGLPAAPAAWTRSDWTAVQELALAHRIECFPAMQGGMRKGTRLLADYGFKWSAQATNDFNKSRFINGIKRNEVRMMRRQTVLRGDADHELTGCIFVAPVYDRALDDLLPLAKDTDARQSLRWLSLTSLIVAPIDFKVLAQAVWTEVTPDLGVELFSSTNQTAETWLNVSPDGPRAADPQFKPYLSYRASWPMYADRFSMFFYTTPLFDAQSPRKMSWLTFCAGAGMTLLATALVGVALRARNRQERMTDQIREARDALAAAQKEREKLSHDLHDNTIQTLYALQLGLNHTSQKLEAEPASARRELSAVRAELDAVIAEIRRFITAEEEAEKATDLAGVLRSLVERAQVGASARIKARCDPDASARLAANQAVQLANIAREALSNSLRHGQAKQVQVALRSEPDAVCLEVSDDGAGFDPASQKRGVGLTSMATRACAVGAALDLQSSPGRGTRVMIRVPASPLERD